MKINSKILEKFFLIFDKKISENEKSFLLNWENFLDEKKILWWLNKNFYSKKFLEKTLKYKKLFSFCPFVKWIFIWNTVAFWSANEKSDIDLFIIFENWKIWTWRLILTFLIHIFWVRRHWNKISWRFCLSFFASEKWAFELENIQIKKNNSQNNYKYNDIYLAIWTATLIPIFWEKKFFEKFYEKNKWIENYWIKSLYQWEKLNNNFKNFLDQTVWAERVFERKNFWNYYWLNWKKFLEKILNFNFIENFLRKILKKRSLKKKKNNPDNFWIIISDDYLKFHDNDRRKEIMEKIF